MKSIFFQLVSIGALLLCVSQAIANEALLSADEVALINRGGAVHSTYEIDTTHVIENHVEEVVSEFRSSLREMRVHYTGLKAQGACVGVTIKEPKNLELARIHLKEISGRIAVDPPTSTHLTFCLSESEINVLNEAVIRATIEQIRIRIAKLINTNDKGVIERLGTSNRFVLQFPKGFNPDTSLRRVNHHDFPSRMTFHLMEGYVDGEVEILPESMLLPLHEGVHAPDTERVVVSKRVLLDAYSNLPVKVVILDDGQPTVELTLPALSEQRLMKFGGEELAIVVGGEVLGAFNLPQNLTGATLSLRGLSLEDAKMLERMVLERQVSGRVKFIRRWVSLPNMLNLGTTSD